MKTTIKLDIGKAIVITPNNTGRGVRVSLEVFGASMGSGVLAPDQCGALINALEECSAHADGCFDHYVDQVVGS